MDLLARKEERTSSRRPIEPGASASSPPFAPKRWWQRPLVETRSNCRGPRGAGLNSRRAGAGPLPGGQGGGDIRREQAPVGPTSRLLPRRIYSSPYPIFSFSRHTRYFPIGRNQNLKQKQNQLRESRKTGGRPGFGAAGCGGSQTQ